jgi:SAM-dependent methyltransferase|tara:strand:- start:2918 stop:4042 length:1125 start_codon:yes stop_codon:yes gene_type:complete
MDKRRCRVCSGELRNVLFYENMPKAAQHLPTKEELPSERGSDLQVCECVGCGLVQLDNEPVPYYKEVIRSAAFSEEMKEFRVEQFKNFIEKNNLANKKIIEIGCGYGEYLSLMSAAGANCSGIEYSAESVRQCKEEGLDVNFDYLEESTKLKGAPFDGFFILNFLEHFPHPRESLIALSDNLNDGAIGLVEVPNFDMVLKGKLFSEFIGDHLLYFTKDTLKNMLSLCGFEVLSCNEIWYDYIISAVVRKRAPLNIIDFYDHQENIKKQLVDYTAKFNGNVAIYGAGHQSFAIISLTKIADSVKYVVDDALFKQDKYTPATHVPIVSADRLQTDPVEGIIIMAGGYSDEVARKLERLDLPMSVSIMRDHGLEIIR